MKKLIAPYLDWFIAVTFLVYGLFLFWNYWGAYPTYEAGFDSSSTFYTNIKSIIVPFILIFFTYLGVIFWQKDRISLAKMILFLWLGIICFLLILAILQPQDIFVKQNILFVLFKFLLVFGGMFLASIFFSMLLIILGQFFLSIFSIDNIENTLIKKISVFLKSVSSSQPQKSGMEYWLYFFVGFFVISFFGFFLSKMNLFVIPIFVSFITFIVIYFWSNFKSLLDKLFVQHKTLTFWQVTMISLILSVIILNFSQTFFPFSLGWDSANHYLLTTKLLIEEGHLRSGIFPAFIEIILAVFGKFTGLSGVQFLLVFWGSFLPFSFYRIGKQLKLDERLNILLALSFFLIPAMQFQLSKDLKLDIIYLQLLLVIFAYFQTKRALLLLGCAPLAKLTAFWLFPVAFLSQFIGFSRKKIKAILIAVVLLLLPFSIWSLSNLINYGSFPSSKAQWQQVLLRGQDLQPKVKIPSIISMNMDWVASTQVVKNTTKKSYNSTSFKEEVGRYSGNETNFFKKIWAIFMSPNIPSQNKQYIDLGFLWMIFLPVLILILYEGFKKRDEFLILGLLGLSFFLPWILVAEGIAWYGGPFLLLLFLLSGKLLARYKEFRFTNLVVFFFVFLSVFMGLIGRISHSGLSQTLTSFSWAALPTTENANRLANIYFNEERAVTQILNNDNQAVIFRIGTLAKFWLDNPDVRVVEDPQLEIWGRINHGRSIENVLGILNKNKIKYILIDRGTTSIETNKKGTLHKKFESLELFIQTTKKQGEIKILFFGKRIILVELST